jgi:hypothetical protein
LWGGGGWLTGNIIPWTTFNFSWWYRVQWTNYPDPAVPINITCHKAGTYRFEAQQQNDNGNWGQARIKVNGNYIVNTAWSLSLFNPYVVNHALAVWDIVTFLFEWWSSSSVYTIKGSIDYSSTIS